MSTLLAGVLGHGHAGANGGAVGGHGAAPAGGHAGPAGGHLVHAGHEGHTEGGQEGGFPILSPYVLSVFLGSFGVAGYAALSAGLGWWLHLPIAVAAGVFGGGTVGTFLWKLATTWSPSGEAQVARFAGMEAKVSVGIPEGGIGEVGFVLDGGRRTASARTVDGHALSTGTVVIIQEVRGSTVVVREEAAARIKRLAESTEPSGDGTASD